MSLYRFQFLFLIVLSVVSSTAQARTSFPMLKVVPWNGHKAATSFTFDEGNSAYLDKVIPELNHRHLQATFFLVANKTNRKDEWSQAIKAGHEIGNQTLDYLHAGDLSPRNENAQVVGAQNVLQKEFGVSLFSFAYPYGEVSPGLKSWVEKISFISRGQSDGWVSPKDSAVDWFNLPVKETLSRYSFKTYKNWINKAERHGDWLIWDIQGIEGMPSESISHQTFDQVLDYLSSKDIWVGTLTEVGSYLRACKSFETAVVKTSDSEKLYIWVVPEHCPMNVRIKVHFGCISSSIQVWQNGQQVISDAQGNYTILFNQGQLSLHR